MNIARCEVYERMESETMQTNRLEEISDTLKRIEALLVRIANNTGPANETIVSVGYSETKYAVGDTTRLVGTRTRGRKGQAS